MRCYECAKTGRTQEAVALCQHRSAGLCVSHLRRAAAHRAHTTGCTSASMTPAWTGRLREAHSRGPDRLGAEVREQLLPRPARAADAGSPAMAR